MKLYEVISCLDSLDDDSTIYAAEPWTKQSEALVLQEPDSGNIPTQAQELRLKYFLEVFIAREFLSDWIDSQDKELTLEEKFWRLIQYAINDC